MLASDLQCVIRICVVPKDFQDYTAKPRHRKNFSMDAGNEEELIDSRKQIKNIKGDMT